MNAERKAIVDRWYAKNQAAICARGRKRRADNLEQAQAYGRTYGKAYAKTPKGKENNQRKGRTHNQRRREAVNAIAMHYGCQNPACSCRASGYMPEELDFHHLDNKEFSISQRLSTTKAKLAVEVNKCVVLCSNCHRRLHAQRFSVNESMRCLVNEELEPIPAGSPGTRRARQPAG